MRTAFSIFMLAIALAAPVIVEAQAPTASAPVPVTVENFVRAESDLYFTAPVKKGGFGKFEHNREFPAIDKQTVVRLNRDTLYSAAVFDLDAGAVTISLPDPGERFQSMQVFNEDQYTQAVFYGGGSHMLTRDAVGTRYAMVGIRILVDPADPKDLQQVHALQDAIKVEQKGGPGRFEVPNWDLVSQKKVREALLVLASTLPDTNRSLAPAATRECIDFVRYEIPPSTVLGPSTAHAPGTVEHMHVATGIVRVTVGEETAELAAGDSCSCRTDVPHAIENPDPSAEALIYLIVERG